ncbi:MAG: DUF1360 domain-containing protein [Desulfobulbaceae bacterium]|nr:DUF1360 domain-containing protein [Desulfobulbaceae bacterium]
MKEVFYLSIVAASISFTVSEAKLFSKLRGWAHEKSPFFGELFSCGYCFGFWVALALTVLYTPCLFSFWWPLDYVLTALVIAWFSAWQWGLMCWLMEKAGK